MKNVSNHALPVLVVVRFLRGGQCGVFLPLAGACGVWGFWAWACACDSRYARGRAGALGGRSASRAKAPGTFARGELSFPPFFGDPKKGGAGVAGARSPRGKAWAFLRLALRPWQDLHERFGTVRAGTRGWAGNSRPAPTSTAPTKIAIVISLMGRNGISHIKRRGTPRRYGLREMELRN